MNIFTLPQSAGGVLLGVAILLTAGFLMTRLTRRLHLPNVTGYILAGILVGPYALNLIPAWLSGGMEFVTDLALSYIAFSAGRYFRIADLKRSGGKVLAVTLAEALCAAVAAVHPGKITRHAANTASIFRYPQAHADMVRGGIALYGYPPVPEAKGLRPAMRWVTRAVFVKTIAPGERVSYGGLFTAQRETRVMTVPVGYADGYRRGLSGRGCVLVRGRRAPILGRVCMDQIMVDVTDIPGAQAGDEVVLLGAQGNDCIDAQKMADWLGTISYEVLCSPSARVPRVWLGE